jgi:hypothetical protein
MAYLTIPIPGGSTRFEDAPVIRITGGGDEPLTVTICYNAAETTGARSPLLAEVTFTNVLEYRWVAHFVDYYPDDDEGNFEFGLIQIVDSKHIEEMAAKGPWREYPGRRFGDVIAEAEVKHYRMAFDDYGLFDIIALDAVAREVRA